MKKSILSLTFVFTLVWAAMAQLKTPEQFLGYKPGDRFTPHHRMVDYFEYVASQNPNIKLIQYGETNEKRPLIMAILSSPENMRKLNVTSGILLIGVGLVIPLL